MKTSFAKCLLPLVLLAPVLCAAQTDLSVTYQINPQHTGAVSTPNVLPPLKVKWSVDMGDTVSYPLIAQNMIFVTVGSLNSGQVNLYGLDAGSGSTIWGPVPIPQGAYWWAAAAYDNGMIFVVPNTVSGFGNGAIYTFDANDGHALWTAILPGQYFFTAPPTVGNGMVYTGGAGSGGTLYAVRETDGEVMWTASVENGDNSSPVVTPTAVYVSYVGPQTYKFVPKTGHQIWHYSGPGEGGGGATPVLYNGLLYVRDWASDLGQNGDIFNAATGALAGSFEADFAPAFTKNTAFYVQAAGLTAVDVTSGATVWTASPNNGSYSTPPIVVNGIVYVGTSGGYLLGYRSKTGGVVASMNLGYVISASETGSVGSVESGLGAGQGLLLVPASTHLFALSR
ncbi:MAG TPA: PQQ-binding-like beta-propeller repeat protein [Candidatus Solibacter sp.]|nr:PQQ-binding-like beta-propeller repeat protein [Candidatus Solibacter sp.]